MKRFILILITAVAAVTALQAQPPERTANQDKYYVRRATHFDDLPVYRNDIIMLGNSLTDGAEWNELFRNPNVKNRGIIGDIVQGLYERMEPILQGQPRKIFILSGVNDVSHGVDGDSIGRVMEKLIVLIKERSPRTEIYLQSMLPFNTDVQMWKLLAGREQVVIDGNRAMEEVCKRQGVTWINLYPLFVDKNGKLREDLTNDGLHLLGPGYLIWRDAVINYVNDKGYHGKGHHGKGHPRKHHKPRRHRRF
ncbi:MAG: hypothetical protein IKW83_11885 [Muribaculaceae bacterium]|nr:hypothetical protein [Muribaculaceae bacterium]